MLLLLLLLSTPLHQRAASRVQHPKSCGSQQSLPPGGKERLHFVGIRPEVHGLKGRLVGICTQISGRRCDRASGRVGKVVRDVVDLQWKRDMRQGVVTCLCEVGLGCGAFPWIGGAQQEKQMVFGIEGLC